MLKRFLGRASKPTTASAPPPPAPELRVVLLGVIGAGSGRSTLVRHAQHVFGREPVDLAAWDRVLAGFVAAAAARAARAAAPPLAPRVAAAARQLATLDTHFSQELSHEMREHLEVLWSDPAVREFLVARQWSGLSASECIFTWTACDVFLLANAARLLDGPPALADVLRLHLRTTGFVETELDVGATSVRLIEIGGCSWRSTFRKAFPAVFFPAREAVGLLMVDLASFDRPSHYNDEENLLLETLEAFKALSNSRWVAESPIVLCLNKMDAVEARVRAGDAAMPESLPFDDWPGTTDAAFLVSFVEDKFLAVAAERPSHARIVSMRCNCLDASSVSQLIESVVAEFSAA